MKGNTLKLVEISLLSAVIGSVTGSFLMVSYLFATHPDADQSLEMFHIIFYVFAISVSLAGTVPGCLLVGIPTVVMSRRVMPNAPLRASTLIVCIALFTWFVILGLSASKLFQIAYSDILLLSPYVFCSSAALAYLANRQINK
ncbi:hypothetical protein [Agrobacterium tumefaciens]|uniref:hypothetical protein n=1 Tax=Agrobacterium tumefaciens TaxID=358 RepID=UPI00287EAC7E|nr:hypothetical protein [Agrobacterium tumefaciens]MDS7597125.1 hypothetical protein [Agrobacterium tumefaciens]